MHLWGIAFIFTFVSGIFSTATGVALKLKGVKEAMFFLAYGYSLMVARQVVLRFTRLAVIGVDALALSFPAYMWVVSMYEMWVTPQRLPFQDRRDFLRRS